MRRTKAKPLALAVGIMTFGMGMPAAMAFPDGKPKQEGGDLAAILEKLPPDVRDRLIKEIDRVRVEAERLKAEAMERGEQLRTEAAKRIEDVKRDAQERLERVEAEMRRKAESAERTAREQLDKARDQAEAARVRAREAAESAGREARPDARDGRERRGQAEGDRGKAESREMRVEVRSETAEGKPIVRIFKDGREINPDGKTAMVIEAMPKAGLLPDVDLEKLPPEKRAEFERAQDELKLAQEKLRVAMEKMAKLRGGRQENVMVFRVEGNEPALIRPPIGDRLPGVPLPPGPAGRADRLPRQPIIPPPPIQPTAPPELERRMSKAEKALDDILIELKKLQKDRDDDDDDDDDDDEHHDKDKGGRKAKKS